MVCSYSRDNSTTDRRCYVCKETKGISDFPKNKGRPLERANLCNSCEVKRQQNKYSKTKLKYRSNSIMKKYGLTVELFDELIEKQNYRCMICQEQTELVVDHCHATGRIRGALCRSCNTGLGMFRDNPIFLDKAKEYLANG